MATIIVNSKEAFNSLLKQLHRKPFFTKRFLTGVGLQSIRAIRNDARKGILQSVPRYKQYKSKPYMRKKSQGKASRNQISTRTRTVDMRLTGRLMNALRIAKIMTVPPRIFLSYGEENRNKLVGNKEYDVQNLRPKNSKAVANSMAKDLISRVKNVNFTVTINM